MTPHSETLQALFSEIVKLAKVSGSHEARLTRAETDIQKLTVSMATPAPEQRRVSTRDMRMMIEASRLIGKVALWLAPRLLMAWAVLSGWLATAWRWLQVLAASVL